MFLPKKCALSLASKLLRHFGRRTYADYSKTIGNLAVDENTKVIVQGFTGKHGTYHAGLAMEYGTLVMGGVSPRKADTKHLGLPVFATVREAMLNTNAHASILFVPAPFAKLAITEAIEAEVPLIVVVTEGMPQEDMARIKQMLLSQEKSRLLGPNCPGIIAPGRCKIGTMPSGIHKEGNIAIISRSGSLMNEAVQQTSKTGQGQSYCIGIGADPFHGTGYIDCLKLCLCDGHIEGIILIGDIGGAAEERAAEFIKEHNTGADAKPVVAYIAGSIAPSGRRAGQTASTTSSASTKMAALRKAGVIVANSPACIGALMTAAFDLQNNRDDWYRGVPMDSDALLETMKLKTPHNREKIPQRQAQKQNL